MFRTHSPVRFACRLLVGGVFGVAGAGKALDHQAMIVAVDAYDLLPGALVPPVAAALPWVELAVGLALLAGYAIRVAGATASALLVGFLVALAQAKARGLPIDCGCFGAGGPGDGVGWIELARNVPLLAAGLYLTGRPAGRAPRAVLVPVTALALIAGVAVLARTGPPAPAEPRPAAQVAVEGQARTGPLQPGEALPAFRAPALGGGTVAWPDTTGERPTVVVGWAPWCPHCQAELPRLVRVAAEHPDVRVLTVATALDQAPGPAPEQVAERTGLRSPTAIDDADSTLGLALGITSFPTLYLVGSDGVVLHTAQGEVDEQALEAAFTALERSQV